VIARKERDGRIRGKIRRKHRYEKGNMNLKETEGERQLK